MNFVHFLQFIRPKLVQRIRHNHKILFEQKIGRRNENYRFRQELYDYLVRGKFFRASLFLYTYVMYRNKDFEKIELSQDVLDVACGLEFLQSFLLIHDDIMDDDDLRRGKPSFHVAVTSIIDSKLETEGQFYKKTGESLAICMGDILYSYCFEILVRAVPQTLLPGVIECFSSVITQVGIAQMSDVRWGEEEEMPSQQKIEDMYAKKTGMYTFSLPLLLGFLLSKRKVKDSQHEEAQLRELGKYSGILFQIQDDMIELYYQSDVTGKNSGSDVLQNKKTYVMALLHVLAKKKGFESELHRIIEKARKTINFQVLRDFAQELKLWERIRKKQKTLLVKAMGCLRKTSLLEKQRALYENLLDFMMTRKQ